MCGIRDWLWDTWLHYRIGPRQSTVTCKEVLYLGRLGANEQPRRMEASQLPASAKGHLRFVVVSDTHERSCGLEIPPCDVLLHCGDLLQTSSFSSQRHAESELRDFNTWLEQAPCKARVVIAGNHDAWLQDLGCEKVAALLPSATYLEFATAVLRLPLRLANGACSLAELTVYGAPYSRGRSVNRAFQDEASGRKLLEMAPERADIVITHGPAETPSRKPTGCVGECLRQVKPQLHVCGHVHYEFGRVVPLASGRPHAISVNAAIGCRRAGTGGVPVVIDLRYSPS
eukprot:gnl/TRDRNA2_/TRDRNA2_39834_c0_seq1.p1 gnl/TRDRNA2_/TRDRNA2_39834_c0~~gnl/TRDRNA2_/TRDRNA2_39834_c0_seq1.p1  ORF type:complete len:298 (+),score=25.02 gnl/TRDRNA2_/TRDRNA2_39834_c0_seq1:37-894(+)